MSVTETTFLSYLPDPFSTGRSLYCIATSSMHPQRVNASDVSCITGRLVTYDLSALIDDLRRSGAAPPTECIDISTALRLCVGRPRDEGGTHQWSPWGYLKASFSNHDDGVRFQQLVSSSVSRSDVEGDWSLLVEAAQRLQELWAKVRADMENLNEASRFEKVEAPVQAVFAYRQYRGISIDENVGKDFLADVEEEKYIAYAQIANTLGRRASGLNFWNISPYLEGTDAAHLASGYEGGRLEEAFKLSSETSDFAKSFLRFINSSRNELVLRRSLGPEGRVFPIFETMGTVSGRILVSDPMLQQLRRKYRKVLRADPGKKLVYIDYAQFEPGILASLANDQTLINEYNSSDLYTSLGMRLFQSQSFRPLAKRVFLAFSYGMSAEAIARFVTKTSEEIGRSSSFEAAIEEFFSHYPGLANFRRNQERQLLECGFVSSLMGNARRRSTHGDLTHKERRWAVNQPVQSTASLIFKEALCALADEFGPDSLLLPVHDAVLMQFDDTANFGNSVRVAESILIDAFRRRCPLINPSVTSADFDA